jgi:hypothetical protein
MIETISKSLNTTSEKISGNTILLIIFWLVLIFVTYFYLLKPLMNRKMSIIEGLEVARSEVSEKVLEKIKNENIKLKDSFLFKTYRKDYEDTLVEMNDYIYLSMLDILLNNKNATPDKKTISMINELSKFKSTLPSLLEFVEQSE